ncbi:MAG: DUF456 domain-containing protein [Anaerolineae bacterium]
MNLMGGNLDWALIVSLILMIVGLVGIMVPLLPGVLLILAGAVFYAFVEGFQKIGPFSLAVFALLGLVGGTAEWWASNLGAKAGGASFKALLAGMVLGTVGLIFFSLPGAILGSILGVFGVEIIRVKDWQRGLKAGGGWLLGWLLSVVIQLIVAFIMIAYFVWQVLLQ